jgi:hypothetical protein
MFRYGCGLSAQGCAFTADACYRAENSVLRTAYAANHSNTAPMLSVVGEEYIAYCESVKGQYTPMVAIQRYDGTLTYREIVKEDLLRINDDQTVPGGWVFRKSQSTASSWVKRFALVRGAFMFFFHSPQNEKPIAVVPLDGCKLVAPDMGQKTFDEMRTYKANEGFEFDIRHNSRSTVRLYTLSEQERLDWIATCNARIEAAATQKALEGGNAPMSGSGNMVITSAKLTGLSLLPTSTTASTAHTATQGSNTASLPPLPTEPYPYTSTHQSAANYGGPQAPTGTQVGHFGRTAVGGQGAGLSRTASNFNSSFYGGASVAPYSTASVSRSAPYAGYSGGSVYGGSQAPSQGGNRQAAPYLAPQKTAQAIGLNKFRSRKDLGYEFVLLEENLKKKVADQLEARNRESAAKAK